MVVRQYRFEFEAMLARDALEGAGIPAMVLTERWSPRLLWPEFRLAVRTADAPRALEYLAAMDEKADDQAPDGEGLGPRA